MSLQVNDKPQMYISGLLECGAKLEIIQQSANGNIEVLMTPASGIPLSDSADIKDGKLRVRFTIDSFLGAYQLMDTLIRPQSKPKFSLTKWLFGV